MNIIKDYYNFQDYLNYLDGIKSYLSPEIIDFATDVKNYDLSSPNSLHDAWLENISINEISSGERKEKRCTEVVLHLLGPQHDRSINLTYSNVLHLNLNNNDELLLGWGDLINHNFSFDVSQSCVVHKIFFSKGVIEIGFQNITHTVNIFTL